MKTKNIILSVFIASLGTAFVSCDSYLDETPEATISPEVYFTDVTHIQASTDNLYASILPSHGTGNTYGIYKDDATTDNQIEVNAPNRFTSNLWKVDNAETTNWNFNNIYKINFVLSNVLPKFGDSTADGSNLSGTSNTIRGDINEIKHYIGELFFLRACEYFKRYQLFGDFPILTQPLPDDKETLTEASKRSPRNEVARFILQDLDKSITLLSAKSMSTTRINTDAAILLKSRVALFEGTWLKYFKNTAFVPNGDGWPGKVKDYSSSYQYPNGSIDSEIDYFLDIAMTASKDIAERYKNRLAVNTGLLQQSVSDPITPYFDMFAQEDLSSVDEVLLWRKYAYDLVRHNVCVCASWGNNGVGITRSFVNNFLMNDGSPVYTHGNYANGDGYYMGDKTLHDVRQNRDSRLMIFLKEPGQHNILVKDIIGETANIEETYPLITITDGARRYVTGYALRKGGPFHQKYYSNSKGYTASIAYRATEALLNYMEASYEKNNALDEIATEYWKIIRRRSHIDENIQKTINLTDMTKEAENDWGAYSGGKLIDATLYNIRRERRCEFIGDGLRYMDLCRWRAMDQLIDHPYIPEGFHLWNSPMETWYTDLLYDGSDAANVSSPNASEYLRPYQKNSKQTCYNGLTWRMAHYLHPIMVKQFMLTAPDNKTVENSPLYQNPYWPIEPDMPAEK